MCVCVFVYVCVCYLKFKKNLYVLTFFCFYYVFVLGRQPHFFLRTNRVLLYGTVHIGTDLTKMVH